MCNCGKKKPEPTPPPIPKEVEDKFIKELNEFNKDVEITETPNPHPPYPLIED